MVRRDSLLRPPAPTVWRDLDRRLTQGGERGPRVVHDHQASRLFQHGAGFARVGIVVHHRTLPGRQGDFCLLQYRRVVGAVGRDLVEHVGLAEFVQHFRVHAGALQIEVHQQRVAAERLQQIAQRGHALGIGRGAGNAL